jgi:DNA-binding MarR family transcriptional regulator
VLQKDDQVRSHRLRPEIERAAAFRTELRRFSRRSELATSAAGLTPERYDLLLAIKAAPNEESTVSRLCGDLVMRQQAVTELVRRAEAAGLIVRKRSTSDGRVSHLRLSPEGERRLLHAFKALRKDRSAFAAAFSELGLRFHASGKR